MSNFRNVQNNGIWTAGNTYTFESNYVFDRTYLGSDNWTYDIGLITQILSGGTHYPVHVTLAAANAWVPSGYRITGNRASPWCSWEPLSESEILLYPSGSQDYGDPWRKYTIAIPSDTPDGSYGIVFYRFEASLSWDAWGDKGFTAGPTETDKEVLTITISGGGSGTPGGLPGAGVGEVEQDDATQSADTDRPVDYDPDDVWIENAWEDIAGADAFAGGGRWNIQLFFVGKGVIYFEGLS